MHHDLTSRPYMAEVEIDPADFARMEQMFSDADIVRVVEVDRTAPDTWRVWIACPSEEVADRIKDGWG